MSLEHLPPAIEQGVQRFASLRRISHDEAVISLIEAALTAMKPEPGAFPAGGGIAGLSEESMSDEDAAMMDEIVAEAMEARRRRWEYYLRA